MFEVCFVTSRYVNSWVEGVNHASVRIIDSANCAGIKIKIISFEPVGSSKTVPSVKIVNTLFNDKMPRSFQRIAYNLNLQEIGSLYYLPFIPECDIVHILPPLPTIVYSAILRLINKFKVGKARVIPHLFHPFHPIMDEFMWGQGFSSQTHWRQKLWLLKKGGFDHVFCVNQYLKKYVERFVGNEVVHYVPYPVDIKRFKPTKKRDDAREILGLPLDKFIIGYIGQVYPKRGILNLLQAFNKISDELPETSLVIATKVLNPEKPHVSLFLEHLNKMKSKDKIIVLNRVLEKVELFYQAVDIMVLPFTQPYYIIDPPLVVMESLASGIPIITTPVGAISEVTHDGLNVIHVRPGDDLVLSEEIVKLVSDANLRSRLGENARNTALKYSFESVGTRLNEVYTRILE